MKESVSALMDGEVGSQEEAQNTLGAMEQDETLKSTWDEYHLIGDALRNNALLGVNVRQRVVQRLAEEPTVLSPRASSCRRGWVDSRAATWALAASISFATVIGWQLLNKQPDTTTMQVAQQSAPESPAVLERDNSYLLAHQEMVSDPNIMKASVSEVQH
jgi:sigma-E factor negative regulatory protein RseA